MAEAASKTRLVSRLIHCLPYVWQYKIGDFVTNAGRLRHFCFRKKEIEKQARMLLGHGVIKQIVVLGAGLDLLSIRLAKEFPAAKFIEIDTAESQRFKIGSLRQCHGGFPENVEFIEGDLRDPLAAILATSRLHDPIVPTLWIAEGFFMFVPEDSVTRIFKEIRKLCATGSYVLFTTIPAKKITSAASHVLQTLYLKKEKSPFQWVIPFDKAPEFIKNIGYDVISQLECDTLHKNYMGQKFTTNHNFAENMHIVITKNM
jgi:methyltransferase (TIGR00027 family)